MKSSLPANCRSCLCGTEMSNYAAVTASFTELLKPEGDLFSLSRWSDRLEECPRLSLALGSGRGWRKGNGCSRRLSSAGLGRYLQIWQPPSRKDGDVPAGKSSVLGLACPSPSCGMRSRGRSEMRATKEATCSDCSSCR